MDKYKWCDTTNEAGGDDPLFQEWHMIKNGLYTGNWLIRQPKTKGKSPRYKYYFYSPHSHGHHSNPEAVLSASTELAARSMAEAKQLIITLARMT